MPSLPLLPCCSADLFEAPQRSQTLNKPSTSSRKRKQSYGGLGRPARRPKQLERWLELLAGPTLLLAPRRRLLAMTALAANDRLSYDLLARARVRNRSCCRSCICDSSSLLWSDSRFCTTLFRKRSPFSGHTSARAASGERSAYDRPWSGRAS